MSPIRFAQTIVELPKYGASRREAAISVASEPVPAPKTSSARAAGERGFMALLLCPLDNDDGEVVGQLALGPAPARLECRQRQLLRREVAVLREQLVEAGDAVELAVVPRLHDAVGVEGDERPRREL